MFWGFEGKISILHYMINFSLIRQCDITITFCVLHNYIRLHKNKDPRFNKYGLDRIMHELDFDDDEDAQSTSSQKQNQPRFIAQDENVANEQRDHIMFHMFAQYNAILQLICVHLVYYTTFYVLTYILNYV